MEYTVDITDEAGNNKYSFTLDGFAGEWTTLETARILLEAMLALEMIPTTVGKITPEELVDMMYDAVHHDKLPPGV